MSENIKEERVEIVKFRPPIPSIPSRPRRVNWEIANSTFQNVPMSDLTDRVYERAERFARETGRPAYVQGARITITEEISGKLKRKVNRSVEIDMPSTNFD